MPWSACCAAAPSLQPVRLMPPAPYPPTLWCHAEFDALLAQARRLQDQAQRAALYRRALAIFQQQAPWIPLAHPRQFGALRRGVQGFVLSPLGSNNFSKVKFDP